MSHYEPYPAYKDSGVKWFGRVPEHWDIQRIRTLIDSAQNGIWGDDPDGGADDIPCARVADFDRNSFTVKGELSTLRKVPEAQRLSRQVNPGDLLIEKSGGGEQTTVGVVVQYQGEASVICSNFVAVVKPKKGVHPRWLCYTNAHLYSVGVNVRSIKQTTGIQNIDSDQYFSEQIAVPPEGERQAISSHLDRETACIDALIIKKARFIELLREKRQALITHAVTKGLDPHVEMKDSGVEWLGEVPEHWQIRKVVWDFAAEKGRNAQKLTKEYCGEHEGDFAVYSGQTENEGVMGRIDSFEFDSGEDGVLFATTVGARAMDLRQICGKFSLSQNCMIIYPRSSDFIARFFLYHFSPLFRYERGLIPDHMQPSFRMEDLYSYSYACPPKTEQRAITEFVDANILRIDALAEVTERSIELLKERRSALITAAVTGQIDLRESV